MGLRDSAAVRKSFETQSYLQLSGSTAIIRPPKSAANYLTTFFRHSMTYKYHQVTAEKCICS